MGKKKRLSKTSLSDSPPALVRGRPADAAVHLFLTSLLQEKSLRPLMNSSAGFHEFVYQILPFLDSQLQRDVFKEVMRDSNSETISRAAEQLIKLKNAWARELLDGALGNGSAEARFIILQTLGSRERAFALPRFVRACEDPNPKVKQFALAYVAADREKGKQIVMCAKCRKSFPRSEIQKHISHAHTPIREPARKNKNSASQGRPPKSALKMELQEIDKNSKSSRGEFWEWDMTTPNTRIYRRG